MVVGEDRVRDCRRWRIALVAVNHHVDAVCSQHLQRRPVCRLRERMRVPAEIQRAADVVGAAIVADRLGDGEDVRFGERAAQRRAAMAARAEPDPLRDVVDIRCARVVGVVQQAQVDEQAVGSGLTGARIDRHVDYTFARDSGFRGCSERLRIAIDQGCTR